MKKTRMSIDDIHAMVGSIRKNVLNMRVTNIYDLAAAGDKNNKTYILKLHQPPFPKIFLLLESGVRFHTSKYARDASSGSALPSQFTMKLRKHLRGKRLVALTQLEGDRVVDFTFGSDALQCHLILELYASGNIILTDDQYNILSLLRTHKFDDNVKMAVRQVYPVSVLGESSPSTIASAEDLAVFVEHWFAEQEMRAIEGRASGASANAKKPKAQTLKQLLLTKESTFGGLGPVIIEHCIVSAGLVPGQKIKNAGEFKAIGIPQLARLLEELRNGWTLLEKLQTEQVTVITEENEDGTPVAPISTDTATKRGFIVLKEKQSENDMDQFEEFTPYLYAQHAQKPVREFVTFDEAVDEYFSHFEAQNAEAARQNAKAAAENKLEKLRRSQRQQLDQLVEVQEKSLRHAQLVEANQQDVENVLLVVRSALASGMDWRGLEELVRFEQRNGNPVACLIHELDLAHNRVAILLCDNEDDETDEHEEDAQAHVIWIDLALSALANAREIYAKKKKTVEKVKKATEATDRAIEMAERNTKKALDKQQTKRATIYARRKTLWFEKFHWFISSENYLVIGGKDAHQNEILVKRYLRKGDIYVHADLHGAATCVVRNRAVPTATNDADKYPPIPVSTLEQAGWMSVCRSNAWANQVIAGAYWVHADQVSKTAPSGEYLPTGSFMVRGKKNYVNPSRLELGLGIVFRVDESSLGDRADDHAGEEQKEDSVEDAAVDVIRNEDNDAEANEEADEDKEEENGEDVAGEDKDDGEHDEEEDEEANEEEETTEPEAPADDVKNEMDEEPTKDEDGAAEAHAAVTAEAEAEALRDGKKRLSAKQRRDLKKGKSLAEVLASDPSPAPPSSEGTKKGGKKTKADKAAPTPPPAPQQKGNVRGKKGKLKKLKKKYADQDDDDRRLRMEALGHTITAADENDDEHDEQADEEETQELQEKPSQPEPSDEYIRQQREKKEKFLDEQEEEAEAADFFDAFTGTPRPQDLLLFALPMCAPYAALAKHKYKVKLVPGSVKKGKAAKTAMDYFFASNLREEKDLEKAQVASETVHQALDVEHVVVQRELMRCITDNELVACLVGPVKIIAPGLAGAAAKGSSKKGGNPAMKKKGKK